MTTFRKSFLARSVATTTAAAVWLMGCANPPTPVDLASREVQVDVQLGVTRADGRAELQPFTSQTLRLDAAAWSRELVIDGMSTDAVADIYGAQEIQVPLNTGHTATIERHDDLYVLVAADGAYSRAQGTTIQSVRVGADRVELYREGNLVRSAPDVVIVLRGIDDLDAPRRELLATLALTSLIGALDEQAQIAPLVAIALIAGALGGAYMAACGGTVVYCANHCSSYDAFEVKCGGVKVKTHPFSVNFSLAFGCRCYN